MMPRNYFLVTEYLFTSILSILALKPKFLQFLEQFFLDRYEFGPFAHHGTGASLSAELVQACSMKVIFAILALERVNKDRRTEGTQ